MGSTEPGRPIIALSGSPGTGKTAVASALGRLLGIPVVAITDLVRERRLSTGSWDGSLVVDEAALAAHLAAINEPTVVEGHLADLAPAGRVTRLFVLRCRPRELARRLAPRGYPAGKVRGNVLAEGLDSCLIDAVSSQEAGRVTEADTTGRSPEEVAREIADVLAFRRPALPPTGRDYLEESIAVAGGLPRRRAVTRRRTSRPRRRRSG